MKLQTTSCALCGACSGDFFRNGSMRRKQSDDIDSNIGAIVISLRIASDFFQENHLVFWSASAGRVGVSTFVCLFSALQVSLRQALTATIFVIYRTVKCEISK